MSFNRTHYSQKEKLLIALVWLTVLILSSYVSYLLRNFTSSLLLYLPSALSIVMIHWYGYRALAIIYINAIVTLIIWKSPGGWAHILLVATHEPVVAFASKFLSGLFNKGESHEKMVSTRPFVLFIAFGLAIPIALNCFYTYHYSFIDGDLEKVALLWLSDFITAFSLSLPLLFFFSPSREWLTMHVREVFPASQKRVAVIEFWGVVVAFVVLGFFVPFQQYWFIYGIVAVVIGVRQGFQAVLLINVIIFLVNYILPLIDNSTALITNSGSTQLINVHLGNATMLFISTLVGRMISDMRQTELDLVGRTHELEKTNLQLNQTNQELDRFVYSVSHDLSAPLKSIQGLIHLSKMETNPAAASSYLNMMEKSANRLNDFIGEVLDYSKTARKEIDKQEVHLPQLVHDLVEKLHMDEHGQRPVVSLNFEVETLQTDATLLKIILSNLISNALKFQKKYPSHVPSVQIISRHEDNQARISVIDNGEGIQAPYLEKIFEMFYRATASAPGSGLGLYIAREAITKLGGAISVETTYGEGSAFTITLPHSRA